MSHVNKQTHETTYEQLIIISSTADTKTKPVKICWNTGEEKNCTACSLLKKWKAKL